MGWRGRLALASALAVAGCAAIAGVHDPEDEQQNPSLVTSSSGGSSSGSSSGSSGGSSGSSGASSGSSGAQPDAGGDAGTDAPTSNCVAPKHVNGYNPCSSNGQCCSNHCDESATCATDCRSSFSSCNPGDDAPCCFGMYCSTQTGVPTCQTCIGPGGTPRTQVVGGGAKSCCSRQLDSGGKCK
jgi:hypothetical protein